MNGAEALIRTLEAGGVDTCFTNPGTSEIHLVAALDRVSGTRCVLCLFEGVATGAADGFARMSGKPAWTLLHLGPGLGNGLANLHNARRAGVPLINVVGQHPFAHMRYDTPLVSDIEGIARPVSHWLRTSRATSHVGVDTAEAIAASRKAPGRIATLVVPADVAWEENATVGPVLPPQAPKAPSSTVITRTVEILRSGERIAMLLSGNSLFGRGLARAGEIAARTGAKLLAPYPITRLERGAGKPVVERVHYVLEQAVEQLKDFRCLILVGAPPPVAYFSYPGKSSVMTSPGCTIHTLATEEEDLDAALEAVLHELGAVTTNPTPEVTVPRPAAPSGHLTLNAIASAIGSLLPEYAIVADESMTSGRGLMAATRDAPVHDWLTCTGGSIGIAMPLAVGAAVACPQRRVLCLTADGSGMYTAQALWTMAREGLNVTTVVFANKAYAVLKREFSYLGVGEPGPQARNLFDIGRPDIDWVSLAKSMGVGANRATTADEFVLQLRDGLCGSGPRLIEVPL
jgi:acetolactate synthase-1/2/3 large subunit